MDSPFFHVVNYESPYLNTFPGPFRFVTPCFFCSFSFEFYFFFVTSADQLFFHFRAHGLRSVFPYPLMPQYGLPLFFFLNYARRYLAAEEAPSLHYFFSSPYLDLPPPRDFIQFYSPLLYDTLSPFGGYKVPPRAPVHPIVSFFRP